MKKETVSRKSSKVTIDNIRRILSSYFSWLEDEDYIRRSTRPCTMLWLNSKMSSWHTENT